MVKRSSLLWTLFPQLSAQQMWDSAVNEFHATRANPESYDPSDAAWAAYRAGLLTTSDEKLRRQARILRRETAQMKSVII